MPLEQTASTRASSHATIPVRRYVSFAICAASLAVTAHASGTDGLGTFNGPAPGMPRAWQGSVQVTPYSVYNLYNANTITTIPLTGCDPAGPPLRFVLYHNTADAAANRTCAPGTGWHMGYGWSTSYSGRVEGEPGDDVIVIADDGSRDVFTYDGGAARYVPAAWNHNRLEFVEDFEGQTGLDCWVLTSPDQSTRVYEFDAGDEVGRLIEERDSIGLAVTVVRDTNHFVTEVQSAVHDPEGCAGSHALTFFFPTGEDPDAGLLTLLTDPIYREWELQYGGGTNRRVEGVEWPREFSMTLSYITGGRYISALTDRDGRSWDYDYGSGGKLSAVTDLPSGYDPEDPNEITYEQQVLGILVISDPNYAGGRTIEDRRGEQWDYYFDSAGDLRKAVDPLDHRELYEYDAAHNLTQYKDALDHVWTATYGPVGNVETVGSPIGGQTWEYDWEAVGDPNTTNFYRLIEARDPNDHWVQIAYPDPNDPNAPPDPTLVMRVIEMPATDDPNDAETVTRLRYYTNAADVHSYGQVYRVTDGNGVVTTFEYDQWGYVGRYMEGWIDTIVEGLPPWVVPFCPGNDKVGRPAHPSSRAGAAGNDYDADGNPIEIKCFDPNDPNIIPDSPLGEGCISFPPVGRVTQPLGDAPIRGWGFPRQCLLKKGASDPEQYDPMGRPIRLERCFQLLNSAGDPSFHEVENIRRYDFEYDDYGRTVSQDITSLPQTASNATTIRTAEVLEYDEESRPLEMLDAAGRLITLSYDARGDLAAALHDDALLLYEYDAAGRLERVETSDGQVTHYAYDAAGRVTQILHEDAGQAVLQQVDYVWNLNNTVRRRVETDAMRGSIATTYFTYDRRERLTREVRDQDGQVVYDLAYAYDAMGNRASKTDAIAQVRTAYHYDTDAANPFDLDYPSRHNRLLYWELFDTSGESDVLLRTVRYTYYQTGAVSNITIQDEYLDGDATPGDPAEYDLRHDLALYYYSNGQLWRAQWSTWAVDENGDPDWLSQRDDGGVREFRYDDPRARYVTADYVFEHDDVPPDANNPLDLQYPVALTDYLGVSPTVDAEVSRTGTPGDYSWPVDVYTHYFLGLYGQQDAGSGEPTYYHGDLIGSTLATSDDAQELVQVVAYTAFGEHVELIGTPDPNDANVTIWSAAVGGALPEGFPRYGYAGQHGYESGLLSRTGANPNLPPITLQHLGWRWYDPSIGRFVQRDPAGIIAGFNVYLYAESAPLALIDAEGLSSIFRPGGKVIPGDNLPYYNKLLRALEYRYGPKPPLSSVGKLFTRVCVVTLVASTAYEVTNVALEVTTGQSLDDRLGEVWYDLCPSCFSMGL